MKHLILKRGGLGWSEMYLEERWKVEGRKVVDFVWLCGGRGQVDKQGWSGVSGFSEAVGGITDASVSVLCVYWGGSCTDVALQFVVDWLPLIGERANRARHYHIKI